MAKKRGRGVPPSRRGGGDGGGGIPGRPSGGGAEDGGRRRPLPRPNVSLPEHGDDPSKFGAAGLKGMVMNPIYAGVGDYPMMIPEDQWVAAARQVLHEDGPDQFLVNLLYVLRRTFGCVEWGGDMPPDAN
jgi:hypothetical protein